MIASRRSLNVACSCFFSGDRFSLAPQHHPEPGMRPHPLDARAGAAPARRVHRVHAESAGERAIMYKNCASDGAVRKQNRSGLCKIDLTLGPEKI